MGKISPGGSRRRFLNKGYGHLSSPRERRLFLRRSSSSDLSLPLPVGSAVWTPGLFRLGEKLIESVVRGLISHRSIIKVRGGGRGLRYGIFHRGPVFPDIIRGFRRGRALALSGLLLIPGRRFFFALLLSPFLFLRSPSTSSFPVFTRSPAGPFSIFEILTDGEAAQDNADEEAGCAPGRYSQKEKDRGYAKQYVGELGVGRRENTIFVADRADILVVSLSGIGVAGAGRTPREPFADLVFFFGYVFVHPSITTVDHCLSQISY